MHLAVLSDEGVGDFSQPDGLGSVLHANHVVLAVFAEQVAEVGGPDGEGVDVVALAAIAGGRRNLSGNCCQEEAHDEPWGRCPGMRPMRKWLFGGSPQSV